MTGVAPVSRLDHDRHRVLEYLILLSGLGEPLPSETKGMHALHTPGHSLGKHSPTGLSKCYTSHAQPQGRARAGSEASSQKLFFLQPGMSPNATGWMQRKRKTYRLTFPLIIIANNTDFNI